MEKFVEKKIQRKFLYKNLIVNILHDATISQKWNYLSL